MNKKNFAAVILAGGLGKRMGSQTPKVLHAIGNYPMILRTVETIRMAEPTKVVTVANPANLQLLRTVLGQRSQFVIQEEPLGTADAVKTALKKIPQNTENIAVLYGDDSAFYKPKTIGEVYDFHIQSGSKVTFVTLIKDNPGGMGRVLREGGKFAGLVEEKDATEKQKSIKEINDGLYFFEANWLRENINKLKKSPVTGEYYLTEIINLALKSGDKVETFQLQDVSQWHGVNTLQDLAAANEILKKKVHFMGIGGAGASAAAAIAKNQGYHVSGCDLNVVSSYESNLEGIHVDKGHSGGHLHGVGMLVVSAAILKNDPKNSEVVYAKKSKIPVMLWEEFQSKYLTCDKILITVSGAYGKSTTTAMVCKMLVDAGFDPTCEIGAKVLAWDTNYRIGNGAHYVLEADEYQNKFQLYCPDIAIVLNTGWDHPDFFKTRKSVEKSYKGFIERIKPGGTLIIPKGLGNLVPPGVNAVYIESFTPYKLNVIGDFRKENADAAMTLAKVLSIDENAAKKSVESFTGLGRRLECKGKIGKTVFYDDYAVQPLTVEKTTQALRKNYAGKKFLLVFEPHTFSRINTFYHEFILSLDRTGADEVFVTDVYGAREQGDVVGLSKKLTAALAHKVLYTGSIENTADIIKQNLDNFDVVLSMGAGNVYKIFDLVKGKS